jgi:putative flippase GtrA
MQVLLRKLFIDKTNRQLILLFRYLFVAGAAFSVDFLGLILLKEAANINYLVAATISFCFGVIINFYLSIKWIFLTPKLTRRHHEFAAVLAIAGFGLAINDFILWLLTSHFGIYYIYSKLLATAIVFFWNFYIRKWLIYN